MNKRLKIMALMILITLIFSLTPINAQNQITYNPKPIIDGDKVYVETDNFYLSATPHTLKEDGFVIFEYNCKKNIGDFDILYGFNNPDVKIKDIYKWEQYNHYYNKSEYVISDYNVDKNGSKIPVYTKKWTNTTKFFYDWKKETKINSIDDTNIEGFNKWYTKKPDLQEKNKINKIKVYFDIPFNSSGKYWFSLKPNKDTIQKSVTDENFFSLDPWWDASYNKRKQITITDGINGYELKLNISYATGMQDDFDDLRFIENDDTTAIPFWIERYTANEYAHIWVKLPDDIEANNTFWLYYENPAVSTISNGTNVFLYFDDFLWDTTGEYVYAQPDNHRLHFYYNIIGGLADLTNNFRYNIKYNVSKWNLDDDDTCFMRESVTNYDDLDLTAQNPDDDGFYKKYDYRNNVWSNTEHSYRFFVVDDKQGAGSGLGGALNPAINGRDNFIDKWFYSETLMNNTNYANSSLYYDTNLSIISYYNQSTGMPEEVCDSILFQLYTYSSGGSHTFSWNNSDYLSLYNRRDTNYGNLFFDYHFIGNYTSPEPTYEIQLLMENKNPYPANNSKDIEFINVFRPNESMDLDSNDYLDPISDAQYGLDNNIDYAGDGGGWGITDASKFVNDLDDRVTLGINLSVDVTNEDPVNLNATFSTNKSGSWEYWSYESNLSYLGDTANSSLYDLKYNTTYWWAVNITDGTSYVNRSYNFTTIGLYPIISNINPPDQEENVENGINLSFNVTSNTDPNNASFNISFWTNASGSWERINYTGDVPIGSYFTTNTSVFDTGGTKYFWSINVSAYGGTWSNKTLEFTTIFLDASFNITILDFENRTYLFQFNGWNTCDMYLHWYFGDGSADITNKESIIHRYSGEGPYKIILNVELKCNEYYTDTYNQTITCNEVVHEDTDINTFFIDMDWSYILWAIYVLLFIGIIKALINEIVYLWKDRK